MNELQIFKNSDFGEIRTVTIDNEVWFVASDICKALDIKNTTQAVQRLDDDEKSMFNIGLSGGDTNFVNEYGLYTLVLASKKKEAKTFKRWITHEVIPSIRKTGSYQIPKTPSDQIKLLAQGYTELEEKVSSIDTDLQDFKETLPLLAVDCEVITNAVRKRAIEFLGGKNSNAYNDKNLRGRVYADLHREVKHQFGVSTYKAIRRNQVENAIGFIENYEAPYVLKEKIQNCNAQISIGGI